MLKKLSLLLAVVMICTNMGIIAPVYAQTLTEETVLVQSNFENCNFGTYTAENQKSGETDLRNGVVISDESGLTTGYTINDGNGGYEPISEADIVTDVVDEKPTKVLRLNSFLSTSYDLTKIAYPTVQTGKLPNGGKVKIDFKMKMTYPTWFYSYHSSPILGGDRGLFRTKHETSNEAKIMYLKETDYGHKCPYNAYNTFTVIVDTATCELLFFVNGEYLTKETSLKEISKGWQFFLRQVSLNDSGVKPTPVYNSVDGTKIESVTNPQYIYISSRLK